MTGALVVYSATFMRYSLAVSPRNYLLFGCHLINFSAQVTQGYRYLNHFKYVMIYPWSAGSAGVSIELMFDIAGEARKQNSHRRLQRASRLRRLVHKLAKQWICPFFSYHIIHVVCALQDLDSGKNSPIYYYSNSKPVPVPTKNKT